MTIYVDTDLSTDPKTWTKAQLIRYVGGLSNPSKMPCFGYSLPAQECITGSKLRLIAGSVCSKCYALKGRYPFPRTQSAMYRRLESLSKPLWVEAIAELISRTAKPAETPSSGHPKRSDRKRGRKYFRWHDSGDLQSVDHLDQIVRVCNLTPEVQHWIPCREYQIVQRYLIEGGEIPPNLTIRMSAHMIDGKPPEIEGFPSSTVSTGDPSPGSHVCPAYKQGGFCGNCRACWDPTVEVVDYPLH
jgi:hypothetical protein